MFENKGCRGLHLAVDQALRAMSPILQITFLLHSVALPLVKTYQSVEVIRQNGGEGGRNGRQYNRMRVVSAR